MKSEINVGSLIITTVNYSLHAMKFLLLASSVLAGNVGPSLSFLSSTTTPLSFLGKRKSLSDQSSRYYQLSADDSKFHHVSYPQRVRDSDINKEAGALSNLSVSELKRLLEDRGVDFRDCLEKRDLVDRLIENKNAHPSNRVGLSREETRVVNTFQRASPSVAFISVAEQQTVQRGFSIRGVEVPTGTGSGFLWDKQGNVVTNYHVIASATKMKNPVINVKLQGVSKPLPAKIVGYEPEKDLAVLRIPSRNLPDPVKVGSSDGLEVGQNVLAIGNPFGLDYTLTTGIVSALGREVQGIGGRPIKDCIQSDAAINPGNSGGPLLDSSGRLIGVNMAIYSPSGASAGIGFSIPVDTVRRVVNEIIRFGKVTRPSLGLNIANDSIVKNIAMQLRRELNGVMPVEVLTGSPSEKAGIKATVFRNDGTIELGDLITEVNEQKVNCVEDLLSSIESKSEGDVVVVKVWRKCDKRMTQNIRVKLTTSDKLKKSSSKIGSASAWE